MLGRRPPEPPEHLFQPSYQNMLRAIGRHLDTQGYRSITILEVEGGFVLRVLNQEDPTSPQAIELPHGDVQGLVLRNFTARGGKDDTVARPPLCPTGYEDFLRALGYELDRNSARSISVQELADGFAVAYVQLQQGRDSYLWESRSVVMQSAQIYALLNEAFKRRTTNKKR